MKRTLLLLSVLLLLVACGSDQAEEAEVSNADDVVEEEETKNEVDVEVVNAEEDEEEEEEEIEVAELTPREEIINEVVTLFDDDLAFDTGTYQKGDIPKGEYAFITFDDSGGYYSEVDASGSIIDNENFDSFGYVQVHEAGEIETRGVLVNVQAFEELDVSGAKEIYELMNEVEDYSDGGWYKVGADIEPGEHNIESYGSGYVAAMSGPVGNNKIIENDNFEGEYSISLQEGDYLVISRSTIVE